MSSSFAAAFHVNIIVKFLMVHLKSFVHNGFCVILIALSAGLSAKMCRTVIREDLYYQAVVPQ